VDILVSRSWCSHLWYTDFGPGPVSRAIALTVRVITNREHIMMNRCLDGRRGNIRLHPRPLRTANPTQPTPRPGRVLGHHPTNHRLIYRSVFHYHPWVCP